MKALAALIQGRDPLGEIGKRHPHLSQIKFICVLCFGDTYVFPSLLFLFILFHFIFATRFEHQTKTGHYENSFILKCFTFRR